MARPRADSSASAGGLSDASAYEYVEEVNPNLVCCICRNPFINPVQSQTCGHVFCARCADQALAISSTCPVDRSPLSRSDLAPVSKIVSNLVDELPVRCKHASAGCTHTCERWLLQRHLRLCEWERRARAEDAQEELVEEDEDGVVDCLECGKVLREADLESHIQRCHNTHLTCMSCSLTLPAPSLPSHLLTCPDLRIPCPYHPHGCAHISPRHSMPSHLASCVFARLSPVLDRLTSLESENAAFRTRAEQSERALRDLRGEMDATKRSLGNWFIPPGAQPGEWPTPAGPPPIPPPTHNRRSSLPPLASMRAFAVGGEDETSNAAAVAAAAAAATDHPPQDAYDPTAVDPYSFPFPPVPTPGATPAHTPHTAPQAPAGGMPAAQQPRHNTLETAFASLRSSVATLTHALNSLERRQDMMLTTESLRTAEEIGSLRAIVQGLRMQVHYSLTNPMRSHVLPPPPPHTYAHGGGEPSTSTSASAGMHNPDQSQQMPSPPMVTQRFSHVYAPQMPPSSLWRRLQGETKL